MQDSTFDVFTSATAKNKNSCLGCDHYISCADPKKKISYSCSKFVHVSMYGVGRKGAITKSKTSGIELINPQGLILPNSAARASHVIGSMDEEDKRYEFNLAAQVLEVVMSNDKSLSRDLKVPDGDFALAPNFYTFCTNSKFLKGTPYPWQVLIPTIFLAEFCPRCTDQDYLFDEWLATDKYTKIEKKVAFLEHGVCPHCKATRSEMVGAAEMNFYEEAALCLGQRSGKSANFGDVAAYTTHQQIKLQNPNEVYGLKSNNELHGTFCALTYGQAKDTLWDPFFNNLVESPWFCIAENTPISLADGTTKHIQDMVVGDFVQTLEGTSVVDKVFVNGVKVCKEVTLADGNMVVGTDDHMVRVLGPDGASLIWKKIEDLTEDDFVVTLG